MGILLYYGYSKEKEKEMKVFSLLGFVDYEGSSLLGVFGSVEDVLEFVKEKREGSKLSERLGYDNLGYVVSELGQEVDVLGEVEYL